ncbi:sugar transferase [Pseudopelagicola sp. nBUS_20]|uniref:sugar transferase n=1 Tax=Pseudopelagicola sp. nBUS_20 TaxID=3395317 RepID=UPI003EBB496E
MALTTVNLTTVRSKLLFWNPKRVLDLMICAILFVAVLPIFVGIAMAVALTSKGSIFFVQKRVGLGGNVFSMYKFRSMYSDAETRRAELEQISDREGVCIKIKRDPRITPIGRFLRRWSMDELPQLINVVLGNMSLVGPRPALTCEVEKYPEYAHERHAVLPGITGLWQVSGRADVGFDEMISMDVDYVRCASLAMDVSILLRTLGAVLSGRGAY